MLSLSLFVWSNVALFAHGISMRSFIQANAEVKGKSSKFAIWHARAVMAAPSASRALLARTDRP